MATRTTDPPKSIDPRPREERLAEAHAAIGDPSRPLLWCDGPAWDEDVVVAGRVRVWGWALHAAGPADVDVRVDDGPPVAAAGGVLRADVAAAHPAVPDAELCGWAVDLDLGDDPPGPRRLTITARDAGGRTMSVGRSVLLDPAILHAQWLAARDADPGRRWPHTPGRTASLAVWIDPGMPAGDRSATEASLAAQDVSCAVVGADGLADALASPEAAAADLLVVVRAGDVLEPHALRAVAEAGAVGPVDLVYADHDARLPDGRRGCPCFKPQWSPALLLEHDYVGPFAAVSGRAAALAAAAGPVPVRGLLDLLVRLAAVDADIWVERVPDVLVTLRDEAGAVDDAAAAALVADAVQRADPGASVEPAVAAPGRRRVRWSRPARPRVSVVIPTALSRGLLTGCLRSLRRCAGDEELEVIVVATTGADLGPAEAELGALRHVVLEAPERPFNYSRVNNLGVAASTGDLLVLLNDDTEVLTPNWAGILSALALRPGIGAVGPLLSYADGTLQQAGVILDGGLAPARMLFQHAAAGGPGRGGALAVTRECSSIGTACAMLSRAAFEEVGGLDEQLAVELNDIDLCLRLLATGRRVLWTPDVQVRHHERASRGERTHPGDDARFRERWLGLLRAGDPYYDANLRLDVHFEPRPAPPSPREAALRESRADGDGPPTRPCPAPPARRDDDAARESIERFVPGGHGDATLTHAEHVARYRWAAALAGGREVLDAACGAGYGARILRDGGARGVTGVDRSPEALATARVLAGEGVALVRGDVLALPFGDASFDLVVSFETIEHVEDPDRALNELRRVLRPGGLLVVSTPNRGVAPAGNPHHLRELTTGELRDALHERFAHVALVTQSPWAASVIAGGGLQDAAGMTARADVVTAAAVPPGRELYAIGVASDGPLPALPDPIVALADPADVGALVDRATEAEHARRRAEDETEALRMRLEAERVRAAHLREQLAAAQAQRPGRWRGLRRGR